jgi:hypothetical protein
MKYQFLLILFAVVAIVMNGCGGNVSAAVSPTSTVESQEVEDQASLIAGLQAAGATVEVGDSITQDFFSVKGQTVKVNGVDLQVFEYENADAMEKDASEVAPDGGSIGASMVMWMDTPHFYKAGRIIALYLGKDQTILGLLNKVIGPQFAGP